MKPSRLRADLALAAVALIWGSTFVLVKGALDHVSTVLFLGLRFGIATAALSALYYARRKSGQTPRKWKAGLIVGALLYLGYLLQTVGLRFTTPAKSAFITGIYIVMVPLLSAAVYLKVPALSEWAGVALAALGLSLMTLDMTAFRIGLGDWLTLGCAAAFAMHILVLGHYSRDMDPDWLSLSQICTCTLIALATFWWVEKPAIDWNGSVMLALGVTSLLGTAVAFWIQTWAQKYTTATRAALVFSLEPVFGWVTSFLVANEVLSGRVLVGALCILAGILLVELKPMSSRSHQLP